MNRIDTKNKKYKIMHKNVLPPDNDVFTPLGWAKVVDYIDGFLTLKILGHRYMTKTWYASMRGDLIWGNMGTDWNSDECFVPAMERMNCVRMRFWLDEHPEFFYGKKMRKIIKEGLQTPLEECIPECEAGL